MDLPSLESHLADLSLPAIRFYPSIDSTNDEAWRWVDANAPHCGLVIADEQAAGRGRFQRRWFTTAGSALAFSLILLSPPLNPQLAPRLTGLGALAICHTLRTKFALSAQIKWPNDILLKQRKVAGVLVETRWDGEKLKAAIVGIGINIAPESVSPVNLPAERLNFPATCVEEEMGHLVERLELLHAVLEQFFSWLPKLSSSGFIQQWEANLAYLDQWVELSVENTDQSSHEETVTRPIQVGRVVGLTPDGSLKLVTTSGKLVTAQVGEIRMKPKRADRTSQQPV
jgi:BirA family transcriptional regulator, biotin operon repressor / biotin---[acetyl-CoA-carboxylase] ligase